MQDAPRAVVDPAEIRRALEAVVRPRMTATDGARVVEAELRARFRQAGYAVRELEFSFSTLPGRYGLPLAGGLLVAVAGIAGALLATARPTAALTALVVGLLVATLPLRFLDASLRRLPWGRVRTANLLFTRDAPRWIVMAHRDTKSQPVPTLVRSAALVVAAVAWVVLTGLAATAIFGSGPPPGMSGAAAGTLAIAAAVLALSPSGNRSPGALDNGTGLAALLALARRVPANVAFLATDGEELGLAGARAAAKRLPDVEGIINLDGLDDHGPVRIAEGRRAAPGRGGTAGLATVLLEEARSLGLEAVRRRLPPLVLVDHQPLRAAGFPALTLLRGDWRSLLRVHRPADRVERLSGTGAAAVATLVAVTLSELADHGGDTLRPDERSGHSPAS